MSTCPKCQKALHTFEYQGIELLYCEECRGFWFQNGRFRETKQFGFAGLSEILAPDASASVSSPAQPEEMCCPECHEPLSPYTYAYSSDIQLYRCKTCQGIWADYQDLERIEELLTGYKESLDEAKAKALPLMMNVKKQIKQQERTREEEQKRQKRGLFTRFFGQKDVKNRKVQHIFDEDLHDNDDENV